MYQHILVPVDGSDTSMLGLRHAIGLARDQKARLYILNVLDNIMINPAMTDVLAAEFMYNDMSDALREAGQKVLKIAGALAAEARVSAETFQRESHAQRVSDIILSEAKRCDADVIVMGTHGRKGFNRLLLGSDAERVLRDALVPILLVRLTANTSETSPIPHTKRIKAAA